MKRKQIIKPTAKFARITMIVFLQISLFLGLTNYAIAQEISSNVISAGGETFTASGVSLDFVIGEIVTESYTAQSIGLTQGFLQGKEGELAIVERSVTADDITVYPNPSNDEVNVLFKGLDRPLSIEILNVQGYEIYSSRFITNPMSVSLDRLNPGLYVIRVIFHDNNFVTKRIIKK